MPHGGSHTCPACKIIIDGGRIMPGAARAIVELLRHDHGHIARKVAAAAVILAETSAGVKEAILHALDLGVIEHNSPELDEAHAHSELACHRAATMRGWLASGTPSVPKYADLMLAWAEEMRLVTTKLLGGEYHGKFTVNGDESVTEGTGE